ncbi:lipoyl(octanoyl) transferase LipB [Skermanella stibiiresistens]|uniref:lipoyl(octanoyl) transferase LipB n=1 Tax=Skermanella stibiiresistens TaxID=913326 RepID=UPI0004ACD4E8|nr:lipoyl(octanoyl) transferase LipB [Skermanella stibiiresistens]
MATPAPNAAPQGLRQPSISHQSIEWRITDEPVPYPDAVAEMEARVAAIRAGEAPELVWLLEHPPLYTAGTSARAADLLEPSRFPTYESGRGGQYTYHGPGQRVAYVLIDLKRPRAGLEAPDIRGYVCKLEEWLIQTLAQFNVKGERRSGRVGIWVDKGPYGGLTGREDKIAAIGVRVRRWVTLHGVALNVDPDLGHFAGIVPCGISEHGVTSLHALGHLVTMPEVDLALKAAWEDVFEA